MRAVKKLANRIEKTQKSLQRKISLEAFQLLKHRIEDLNRKLYRNGASRGFDTHS